MTDRQLMSMAKEASLKAYVPYSHFPVGAAIECDDGTVFKARCEDDIYSHVGRADYIGFEV